MVDAALLNQAQRLDDAEKLEMIHALWDSLDHDKREVSQETRTLVRTRALDADANPDDQLTSEEFWRSINSRYS